MRKEDVAQALRRLIDQTRRTFHHLARAAEHLHDADGLAAGERAVLVELFETGPRTVPEMARSRPVSRQHIQLLVNALVARSLVELIPNPRHLRSKLVQLTRAGDALARRVLQRESKALTAIGKGLDARRLDDAARTLGRVSDAIEGSATAALAQGRRAAPATGRGHGR